MKRTKKFEPLRCLFLKGGEGTSAAKPIEEPAVKVKNEPQLTDRSTDLDDLNEQDWLSRRLPRRRGRR